MSETVCGACGARNSRPGEFCVSCGAFLAWDSATVAQQAAPPPAPADPVTRTTPADSATTVAQPTAPPSAPAHPVTRTTPAVSAFPGEYDAPTVQQPTGDAAWAARTPSRSSTPAASTMVAEADRCSRCGETAGNRRFCPRCGHQRVHPDPGAVGIAAVRPTGRAGWWASFRSDRGSRAARAAWRRSLPIRYRARRWATGVLGVGVLVGALTLIGRDPVGWTVDRWNDLRDAKVPVDGATAVAVPVELPGFPAAAAVDRRLDTAWATVWPTGAVPTPGCPPPRADADPSAPGALLVGLGERREVRAVRIHPGPRVAEQRAVQPRPRQLAVGYEGGCVTVDVPDTAEPVTVEVDFAAAAVWVTVADVWPADVAGTTAQVELAEVEFLARP